MKVRRGVSSSPPGFVRRPFWKNRGAEGGNFRAGGPYGPIASKIRLLRRREHRRGRRGCSAFCTLRDERTARGRGGEKRHGGPCDECFSGWFWFGTEMRVQMSE